MFAKRRIHHSDVSCSTTTFLRGQQFTTAKQQFERKRPMQSVKANTDYKITPQIVPNTPEPRLRSKFRRSAVEFEVNLQRSPILSAKLISMFGRRSHPDHQSVKGSTFTEGQITSITDILKASFLMLTSDQKAQFKDLIPFLIHK